MEDKENKLPENQENQETQDEVQGTPELKNEEQATDDVVAQESKEAEEPAIESVDSAKEEPEEETVGQPEEASTPVPAETQPAEAEASQPEVVTTEETTTASGTEDSDTDGDSDEDDDHHDEENKLLEELDFENPTKEDLFTVLKKFSSVENMRILDKGLKEIRPLFNKIFDSEKEAALEAFIAEGNDSADFDFKGEAIDTEFFDLYEKLRHKKSVFFSQMEKTKDANLTKKQEILEHLRELVDGEESNASINKLKELQEEWRSVGQVPGAYAKTMWANYHALIDRFYDQRSIYFELKELDRKKNLESKLELCERAEALSNLENIKDAIFQLNELHEEFKHVGPIPKEDQEPVWQRFKAASDAIYSKRKDYFDTLKKELGENADAKQKLGDRAAEFVQFNSDRITEWNKKTKELLELQKEWDKIGGLPRESAKEINKHFWGNFKQFFNNKNSFFKALEGQREENLKKKQELLAKAEELKDSTDFMKTANDLKKLQNQWREIGPVPEKFRNEVYKQFKAACDHFFDKKRSQNDSKNKEFEDNLKKKEEICKRIEEIIKSDTIELEEVYNLLDDYADVGFVPRNAIKKIHNRYDEVTDQLIALEDLSDDQLSELKIHVQMSKLKNSPHSGQKIHRKEGAIKRKISAIENDIDTWKTNMGFFAQSKNADQLKKDFKDKIEKAEQELEDLKKQLDVLKEM